MEEKSTKVEGIKDGTVELKKNQNPFSIRSLDTLLTIFATLVSSIISNIFNNGLEKCIFIVVFMIFSICIINYKTILSSKKYKMFCCALILILCGFLLLPYITTKSLSIYKEKLSYFFNSGEQERYNYNSIMQAINNSNTNISDKFSELDKSIQSIQQGNSDLLAETLKITSDIDLKNNFEAIKKESFEKYKSETQINEITDALKKWNDEKGKFTDLSENRDSVELLYKMSSFNPNYYYFNIISAFNNMGINCKQLDINEMDLILWDIERLYALNNMFKDLKNNSPMETFHSEKILKYEDYKMKYEDAFDDLYYISWRLAYTNVTTQKIIDYLNNYISSYYKKFNINFSR